MASLSRLKDTEISNGNVINADDLDAEFNQLVTGHNDHDTRVADIESGSISITGNKTFTGETTFSNATSPIKTDKIVERTSANGVNIDNLLIKDGGLQEVTSGAGVTIDGLKVRDGQVGADKLIVGCVPSYGSASAVAVSVGYATDSTGVDVLKVSSPLSISLASSGANGLDTGTEASNTWYYVYLIKNVTTGTVAGLLSTVNESVSGSITLPTDYTLKRQLPIAVRNNASSNIIPFQLSTGWPNKPTFIYNEVTGYYLSIGSNNVLNGGTATTETSVDCSSLIPPISREGVFTFNLVDTNARVATIRETSNNGGFRILMTAAVSNKDLYRSLQTDSTQNIEYLWSGAPSNGLWVWVSGFVVTEM